MLGELETTNQHCWFSGVLLLQLRLLYILMSLLLCFHGAEQLFFMAPESQRRRMEIKINWVKLPRLVYRFISSCGRLSNHRTDWCR